MFSARFNQINSKVRLSVLFDTSFKVQKRLWQFVFNFLCSSLCLPSTCKTWVLIPRQMFIKDVLKAGQMVPTTATFAAADKGFAGCLQSLAPLNQYFSY